MLATLLAAVARLDSPPTDLARLKHLYVVVSEETAQFEGAVSIAALSYRLRRVIDS